MGKGDLLQHDKTLVLRKAFPMARAIRENEITLLHYLLKEAHLNPNNYSFATEVDEYEGGVMGSIGIGQPDAVYAVDIIQVEYIDVDGTEVIITLTQDTEGRLLDLDFWKVDFSKLIEYPTPEKVRIKK